MALVHSTCLICHFSHFISVFTGRSGQRCPYLCQCSDLPEQRGDALVWTLTSNTATGNISLKHMFSVQQTGLTSVTDREKQRLFLIFFFVLHGDLAVWIDTGLSAAAGRPPTLPSGSSLRISKGGGIRFYINSDWCNDVTVILRFYGFPYLE